MKSLVLILANYLVMRCARVFERSRGSEFFFLPEYDSTKILNTFFINLDLFNCLIHIKKKLFHTYLLTLVIEQ